MMKNYDGLLKKPLKKLLAHKTDAFINYVVHTLLSVVMVFQIFLILTGALFIIHESSSILSTVTELASRECGGKCHIFKLHLGKEFRVRFSSSVFDIESLDAVFCRKSGCNIRFGGSTSKTQK